MIALLLLQPFFVELRPFDGVRNAVEFNRGLNEFSQPRFFGYGDPPRILRMCWTACIVMRYSVSVGD